MKRFFFFVFVAVISLNSNAGNSPAIAVYNVDSVIAMMPEYPAALQKFMAYDSAINIQLSLIRTEYEKRVMEFGADSAKWSPMIRELKRKEMEDLGQRMTEFQRAAFEALEDKRKELLNPIKEKITAAAVAIGKEKGFLSVICSGGYISYYISDEEGWTPPDHGGPSLLSREIAQPVIYRDPKVKTVNITKELIEKLK